MYKPKIHIAQLRKEHPNHPYQQYWTECFRQHFAVEGRVVGGEYRPIDPRYRGSTFEGTVSCKTCIRQLKESGYDSEGNPI